MGVKLERNLMKGKITDLTKDEINIIKNEITKQESTEDYIKGKDIFYVSTIGYPHTDGNEDNVDTYCFDDSLTNILREGLLYYFEDDPEYDKLVNDDNMMKDRFNEVFNNKLICLEINNIEPNSDEPPRFYFTYCNYNFQPISFFNVCTYSPYRYFLNPLNVAADILYIYRSYDINDLIYDAIAQVLPDQHDYSNVTLGTTVTFNSDTGYYADADNCLKSLLGSSYIEDSASNESITSKSYKISLNTAIDLNDFMNPNIELEITANGLRDVLFKNQNCFMTSAYIATKNNVYSGLVMVVDGGNGFGFSIYPPAYDWNDLGVNNIHISSDTQFHLSEIRWPK